MHLTSSSKELVVLDKHQRDFEVSRSLLSLQCPQLTPQVGGSGWLTASSVELSLWGSDPLGTG